MSGRLASLLKLVEDDHKPNLPTFATATEAIAYCRTVCGNHLLPSMAVLSHHRKGKPSHTYVGGVLERFDNGKK